MRDAGVHRVIYTDISRDGAEQGTNLDLYRELVTIQGLEITASGRRQLSGGIADPAGNGGPGRHFGQSPLYRRLDLAAVIREVGAC